MDKKNVQFSKFKKLSHRFFTLLYNKLNFLLKEKMILYTYFSIITCFVIFFIIFSSFSLSLSPEPPIDSTIILLY